jgi:hypothetical protein
VFFWDSWLLESKEQQKDKPDRMKKSRMWTRRRIAG